MKWISLFLLFAVSFALTVDVQPGYVRLPVNTTQTFQIRLGSGEGKVYTLEAFGPYLSWNIQDVWVGPSGKILSVSFSPEEPGTYTLSFRAGGESGSVTAVVYEEKKPTDIKDAIERFRKKVSTPAEKEKLLEIESLYNDSKYDLARIRISELDAMLKREAPESSVLPRVLILTALVALAVFLTKMLT